MHVNDVENFFPLNISSVKTSITLLISVYDKNPIYLCGAMPQFKVSNKMFLHYHLQNVVNELSMIKPYLQCSYLKKHGNFNITLYCMENIQSEFYRKIHFHKEMVFGKVHYRK